ncbi:ParB/RepB/Spo0J family partition protein [Nonomuraea sp. NPDC049152]|uniref:ParB/RepB/Spo0J family partition protein n=1 Tax=Nonomuraea sp. NPDC049152 TaxID=3154350 RepID=UPI0033DA1637
MTFGSELVSVSGDREMGGVEEIPVMDIPIADLVTGNHVRAFGISEEHVQILADCDEELPPILVQKQSLRVIDGMHRILAAELQGRTEIRARLMDVGDANAFLYSVSANIAHGLALSLSDRRNAAVQIIRLYPDWSDRAVARAAGLSGKTVSALRARQSSVAPPGRRLGLDGRTRPVNSAAGRAIAQELLAKKPEASLREIAKEAGISPGTVRRVRAELQGKAEQRPSNGDVSVRVVRRRVTLERNSAPTPSAHNPSFGPTAADCEAILEILRNDPSLRYRDTGRGLLQLLHHQRPVFARTTKIMDTIPPHCRPAVAVLARIYAQGWLELAQNLEETASRSANTRRSESA